jgi:tripartite-type tricarboxylate transporter receptor subunit TctC
MLRINAARPFAAALAVLLAPGGALAQSQAVPTSDRKPVASAKIYPAKPIRMVVPASPGGVTDIVARTVAPRLPEAFGQPVIVDNRAGAGGVIGTDIVARAAPDGYTLLAVFDSFVSNPYVFRNVPYSTTRDFAPVSMLIRGPQLFTVHPKLGVKNFGDFLALAKSRRVPINFATAGPASSSRLSVELFKATARLDATQVHYKGGGPALNDLLGGHVDVMIASAGLVLPHFRNGRLNVLAVTSKTRSSLLPGVPAVSEFYPQFEAQSWVGLLAPAETPRDIVRRLNAEAIRVLGLPDARERFLSQGYETVGSTPEQFGDWIRAESAKWGKMIRDQGITAE